jgi:DNA polymerase I-like protein with 3'-5' exonuclease and polymerase domains
MRLKLNPENYQLLKELCYEEWEKCKAEVSKQAGKEVNVGSPKQVQTLLYKDLGLRAKIKRGTNNATTDENALRELRVEHPRYGGLLNALIKERHIKKKIESYIEFECDEDGYIPYSANPAGTETNRWSFSKSPRNRGLNVQTLPKVMRIMCEAPDDRVFLCPDLPQADARIVAWDARCERLINLFLDPKIHFHLENCIRLFGLTREEAYDPHFKSEDPRYTTGKAMGHAANYRMAAKRLAMELGIPAREAQELLNRYLRVLYPEIERWHLEIKDRIKRTGGLTTSAPFKRHRVFYQAWGELMLQGKLSTTSWNEACAYIPQSVVADIINVGMEKLWLGREDVRFHKHDHDSYLASVPSDRIGDFCRFALDCLRVTLIIHDRPLTMVPEMQVGTNYGQLVEWKGEETLRDLQPRLDAKAIDREKVRKDLYGYF